MSRTWLLSLVTGALAAQTTAPAEQPFLRFVRELRIPGGPVTALTLGPHGRWVASGGVSGVVKVRDVASLRPVVSLDACVGAIAQLAMAPHEPKLAVLGPDLSVWRLPEGLLLARFPAETSGGEASTVAWSRDGRRLAHAAPGNRVTVVSSADFGVVASRRFGGRPVQAIAFGPDGDRLYVTLVGGETTVWDVAADRLRSILLGDGETTCATLPDGRLVQGLAGGGFRLGDRLVQGLLAVRQLAVARGGDRIATGAANQMQVDVFDGEGRPVRTLDTGNHGGICFALGDDGLAATGGAQGHVTLSRHGARLARFSDQEALIEEVAFTGDGANVVARAGEQACAFELTTGKMRERFVASAIATGDRAHEAFVAQGDAISRFDLRTGLQPPTWTLSPDLVARSVERVFVRPGGRQATASNGDVWLLGAGSEPVHVSGVGDPVSRESLVDAAWSSDGIAALVVEHFEWMQLHTHSLWLVRPGEEPGQLATGEHWPCSADWALDGTSLVVASTDGLLRLRMPAGEPTERVAARVRWLRHLSATRLLTHDHERITLWQAAPLRPLASQDLRWLGVEREEKPRHLGPGHPRPEHPRIAHAALSRDLRRVAFAIGRAAVVFDVLD